MAEDSADQGYLQRAVEVMTAWLEDDDFTLAKNVLAMQFEEGGVQAMIDLTIGLAHMNYMNLAQLESVSGGVPMRKWLQMLAESSRDAAPTGER